MFIQKNIYFVIVVTFILSFIILPKNINAQEDEQFELVSVQFHGNFTIPTSELVNIVSAKETPGWLNQFLYTISFENLGDEPIYFDSLIVPDDLEKLKQYYWSNGYFESRFFQKFYLDSENMEAIIVYHIEEHAPFIFEEFRTKGLEWVAPSYQVRINEMFDEIDSTERYSDLIVEQMQRDITGFLRDRGYMLLESFVQPIIIDTAKNSVQAIINYTTGNRYKVKDVVIQKTGEGKDNVKDGLIYEIAGIEPEKYYSQYDISRGQTRLYRTNLFSSALISGITADTSGNYVPIFISTDIGLMHELTPQMVVNNDDQTFNIGPGINYSKKNFLGDARLLKFGVSATVQNISKLNFAHLNSSFYGYLDTRLSFEQPFLFGKPIFSKLENYFTIQKRKNEFDANIYGSKLSFNFELPRKTYLTGLTTYLSWEYSKYKYGDSYIRGILESSIVRDNPNFTQTEVDNVLDFLMTNYYSNFTTSSTNTYLGVQLVANKTNNKIFPTAGYSTNLLIEDGNTIANLIQRIDGSNNRNPQYLKLVFTGTSFLPIFNSEVSSFGVKIRIGNIFNYKGDKSLIPINQRFYAGGSYSIRGWGSRELVPQNSEVDLTELSGSDVESVLLKGVAPGGFFVFEGSIESRNRLIGSFGSALFVDYGNAFNISKDFQFSKLAVAAGVGFRFYTDFAPIRIDFGFKVYDPSDTRNFFTRLKHSKLFDVMEVQIGIGEAF